MGAQLTSAKSAMGSAGGGQGAMRPGEEQKGDNARKKSYPAPRRGSLAALWSHAFSFFRAESADEQPWGSRSVVERLTVIAWQALGKLDLTLVRGRRGGVRCNYKLTQEVVSGIGWVQLPAGG